MLFALPIVMENLQVISILMSKHCYFPCIPGTIKMLLPCTLAQLSTTFPSRLEVGEVGGGGGGGEADDWSIIVLQPRSKSGNWHFA